MTTQVIEASLPADPESVRDARALLEKLPVYIRANTVEDLRLLISELVTNSIRHAGLIPGENVGVKIIVGRDVVRTEVSDPGSGFTPTARTPGLSVLHGWGLDIVEKLASRWGVINNHETHVWFEIDLVA